MELKINPLIKEYIESMNFEQVEGSSLTVKQLENLESKRGFVCSTGSVTDLWIHRQLAVIDVLGIPTVMESARGEYVIMDSFGLTLWVDKAEGTLEYIQGFIE